MKTCSRCYTEMDVAHRAISTALFKCRGCGFSCTGDVPRVDDPSDFTCLSPYDYTSTDTMPLPFSVTKSQKTILMFLIDKAKAHYGTTSAYDAIVKALEAQVGG